MLSPRTVRLLIYSIGIVLLMSLKLVMTESLGMSKLVTVDFEIYGRVQGVCFRKYTQKEGKKLGLIGWCMNTDRGTVIGQLQGEKSKVHEMKLWLQHKGSPSSSIEKAEFRNEKEISELTMSGFSIKK
ncbi:acylphosphatase-1-like [Leptopilina boulardi]|uniref:acylphosphatase-1-like n=1 Tax=Leptopilina boulardi TaxID=63433 RepID=UPI0021F54F66|nr:acylphosphatase-1-like [Leptopilina boulardi]